MTDATAAIQKAIDATKAGGKLVIPLGAYKITDTLLIRKPISLMGSGIGEHEATNLHFYLPENSKRDCAISIEYDNVLSGSSTRNIVIDNIHLVYEWETLGLTAQIHDGISTKNNSEWTVDLDISNVRSRSFRNGLYIAQTYLSRFRNVRATSCGVSGFNFAGFSTSLLVENCYAQHCIKGDGFLINNIVYSTFIACAADDNMNAYKISNSSSVNLTNCGSESNRNTAIYFFGGNENVKIDGFFSHQNGAREANWYGISVHADYGNKNIVISNLNEKEIHELATERSHSIVLSEGSTEIFIENCFVQKKITMNSAIKIDGNYYASSEPTSGSHFLGKIIYKSNNISADNYIKNSGW